MVYAYLLENVVRLYAVNNQPLFRLIRECYLPDECIFIDRMGMSRAELEQLKAIAGDGDCVMIRSIVDLADTPADVAKVLLHFGENGVDLLSLEEPDYDYNKNYNLVVDTMGMCAELTEKKRRLGIERAKAEGRMGRKSKQGIREKVLKLKSADFKRDEIIELCGISRSTYYRLIKSL